MTSYRFTKNKSNCNTIKYKLWKPDETQLTYAEFINLLKSENKDFLKAFTASLNAATQEFSGSYFWECLPVSKETINENFEFVTIKSTSLDNIKQDFSSFFKHISDNFSKLACSFLNLPDSAGKQDTKLVIPLPEIGKDYKHLSNFTKNASQDKQQALWKEVADKLEERLDKKPQWLSTSGLRISFLHVRISEGPEYYSFAEYRNNPVPTPGNPKEKILRNISKICVDRLGRLANAEALKNWNEEDDYDTTIAKWKGFYKVKISTSEEIDLEKLFHDLDTPNSRENRQEIKQAITQNIKQNASDWEVEKEYRETSSPSTFSITLILRNKKTGTKHWEKGISKTQSEEIKQALKNSNSPVNNEKSKKVWYNPSDYPFQWTIGIISSLLLIIITITPIRKSQKKKKKF